MRQNSICFSEVRLSADFRVYAWCSWRQVGKLTRGLSLTFCKTRLRNSPLVLAGDINVDQLRALQCDPFSGEEGRAQRHVEERAHFSNFTDALGLQLSRAGGVGGERAVKVLHGVAKNTRTARRAITSCW